MNITPDNWNDIEQEIRASGIQEAIYDKKGYLKTIVCKDGKRYEMPVEIVAQLVDSGAVKFRLGRKCQEPPPGQTG
jgi:hypothetical protein